jgi:hypothetical protein
MMKPLMPHLPVGVAVFPMAALHTSVFGWFPLRYTGCLMSPNWQENAAHLPDEASLPVMIRLHHAGFD